MVSSSTKTILLPDVTTIASLNSEPSLTKETSEEVGLDCNNLPEL